MSSKGTVYLECENYFVTFQWTVLVNNIFKTPDAPPPFLTLTLPPTGLFSRFAVQHANS